MHLLMNYLYFFELDAANFKEIILNQFTLLLLVFPDS